MHQLHRKQQPQQLDCLERTPRTTPNRLTWTGCKRLPTSLDSFCYSVFGILPFLPNSVGPVCAVNNRSETIPSRIVKLGPNTRVGFKTTIATAGRSFDLISVSIARTIFGSRGHKKFWNNDGRVV